MKLAELLNNTANVVSTGIAGAVAYDGIRWLARSGAVRSTAVTFTTWGLRGVRAVEAGAEQVRLTAGDVISEAMDRLGERSTPPGTTDEHGHAH